MDLLGYLARPKRHSKLDRTADYEHVVIDTPPGDMAIIRSAVLSVPLVLVPVSPAGQMQAPDRLAFYPTLHKPIY